MTKLYMKEVPYCLLCPAFLERPDSYYCMRIDRELTDKEVESLPKDCPLPNLNTIVNGEI